ncbi:efflux RND transporter periplasmic adaptor subunit [Victivallis sp. Marseille-Q1083]|uniref:efflux RND transporter periplasmic adaptor subunit n=1 Tax=Victivallis sp. Marseille-Q1083 TaxID=2717288 RepID=UPI00158D4824|nr:efflux RND transporter periplasmic adaptor subunit [Victivallis sp. Marseille-Q1083]
MSNQQFGAVGRLVGRLAVITATVVVPGGCREEKSPAPALPPMTVQVTEVVGGEYRTSHELIAEVKPLKTLQLVARVSGFLQQRNFREGDYVKQGTLLYLIEPAAYELAVKQAEATLAKARAAALNARLEFDRSEKLLEENVTAPKRYDIARADLQAAEAEVAAAEAARGQAELNLSYTRLEAPFDGWVGLTRTDVGNYIGVPDLPLTELAYIDEVRVEFDLSDRYLSEELLRTLPQGKSPDWPVRIRFADGSFFDKTGRITYWSNQLEPQTATLKLQALFENPRHRLLPGLFVTVILTNPQPEAVVLVGKQAVQYDQNSAFVYVVDAGNVLELRRVEVGPAVGEQVVIRRGLKSGERAVIAGNPRLRPGLPVRIGRARSDADR